jgi:hypothetical protein
MARFPLYRFLSLNFLGAAQSAGLRFRRSAPHGVGRPVGRRLPFFDEVRSRLQLSEIPSLIDLAKRGGSIELV